MRTFNVSLDTERSLFLEMFFRPISLNVVKCSYGTTTVASPVNLVPPTTVTCLSHSASTFVYNAIGETDTARRVDPSAAAEAWGINLAS